MFANPCPKLIKILYLQNILSIYIHIETEYIVLLMSWPLFLVFWDRFSMHVLGDYSPHIQQEILWHQLGVLKFNSILKLVPGNNIRFHRLRVQSSKTLPLAHPLQTPVTNPGGFLHFRPTDYRVSTTSFLGSTNLLKQLTELRGTLCLLEYWFVIKRCNLEQPGEEIHRAR